MQKCLLVIFFLLLFPAPAFAEQSFYVTASPNAFDLSASPGETIKQTLKIRNNSGATIPLSVSIKKVVPTTNGQTTIADFRPEEDYQHWIKVDTASISAQPQEWSFIPFTITVPKTAAFGYYYAIVIAPKVDTAADKTKTQVNGSIALPVLLNVQKDGMKFDGKLESFMSERSIVDYPPVTFLTTFTNRGNVHSKPTGSIFITDWRGKQVAVIDINKEQGGVLPNAKRTFTSTWNDSFITYDKRTEDGKVVLDAQGNPEKKIAIKFDKIVDLRIGKYTATALLVVSGDKKDIPFEAATTFWVFPWHVILGATILLILTTIGLVSTMKSTGKKMKGLLRKK